MKTIIIFSIMAILTMAFLTACNGITKKGNGHVVTQTRPTESFDRILIDGIFPVELSQNGGDAFVKVEADENLQGDILVETHNNRLEVKTKEGASLRSTKMKVYINVKNLNSLDFKSVGNLTTGDTLNLDSLDLNSDAVGKLELNINARYLHADLKSVGATTFAGKVAEARINNKSVGTLSAFGLKADTLMIHNTAVGLTEIYAEKAFYIRSEAIGAVYYKGPGEVMELHSAGIGKVQKSTDN